MRSGRETELRIDKLTDLLSSQGKELNARLTTVERRIDAVEVTAP